MKRDIPTSAINWIKKDLLKTARNGAIVTGMDDGPEGERLRSLLLLFESGADALCDIVVSVTAPIELRRRRAFTRQNMSEAKFNRLIERQLDGAARGALPGAEADPGALGRGAVLLRADAGGAPRAA